MKHFTLDPVALDDLIDALRRHGYRVLGPTVDSGVVRFGEVTTTADLPRGFGHRQEPGRYRPTRRGDDALFAYTVGPDSLRRLLTPPRRRTWTAERVDGSWRFRSDRVPEPPMAVIGVRPCDLAALAVQDRVLLDGPFADPDYAIRRESTFLVAVDCTVVDPTCFCASLGTGPAHSAGHDLALTEVLDADRHLLVGEVGTEAGARMLAEIPHRPATVDDIEHARHLVDEAAAAQTRWLDPERTPGLVGEAMLVGEWHDVADRCLACGNCTLVCPTCFCVNTFETMSTDSRTAGKERRWDTCFSLDHSFMGGAPVHRSVASRYRQWIGHKLSTWVDQFGTMGCVGCGRCITWCPVGIDITEEVHRLESIDA